MSSALVALDSSALQMTDTAARLARSSSMRLVPLCIGGQHADVGALMQRFRASLYQARRGETGRGGAQVAYAQRVGQARAPGIHVHETPGIHPPGAVRCP